MKSFYSIILMIAFLLNANAQTSELQPLTFTEVVTLDSNLTSSELYSRARSWFAQIYRSAQDVLQMDDKDAGQIIGKGNIRYTSKVFLGNQGTQGWIRYTITVQVKQGRYKYEISNFIHEGNPMNPGGQFSFGLITNDIDCPYDIEKWASNKWRNKVWKDIKNNIDDNIPDMISSLKTQMMKPSPDQDSNW